MSQPLIRPMTPADVEPAARAMLLNEFGDRHSHLEFAASHAGCGCPSQMRMAPSSAPRSRRSTAPSGGSGRCGSIPLTVGGASEWR